MTREEIKLLKERAIQSFEIAKEACKRGFYGWAMFHLEQFFQLMIKYFLAKEIGYFPKTHSLEELFIEAGKINRDFLKILESNRDKIKILEEAYLGGRYLPFKYSKEDVEDKIKLAERFLRVVE